MKIHYYPDYLHIHSQTPMVGSVTDDRKEEAIYLYDQEQVLHQPNSVIRKYQVWPGHPASDENELVPSGRTDWRGSFKIYFSMKDACRRMYDTIIVIDGIPYLIVGITRRDGMSLVLKDASKKTHVISMKNVPDMRAPMPGYINDKTRGMFLHRSPMSHNKQGMHSENTFLREAGKDYKNVEGLANVSTLHSLHNSKVQKYSPRLGLTSSYLSPKLALFDNGKRSGLEYLGRIVAEYQGDKLVILRDEDKRNPWLAAAMAEVQLEA